MPIEISIFLWRHAEFLFKSTEKAGIISETAHQAGFADFLTAQYGIPAKIKSLFGNKLMKGEAQVLFKYMSDMIFAHIEDMGQFVKRQILVQMGFNILY